MIGSTLVNTVTSTRLDYRDWARRGKKKKKRMLIGISDLKI